MPVAGIEERLKCAPGEVALRLRDGGVARWAGDADALKAAFGRRTDPGAQPARTASSGRSRRRRSIDPWNQSRLPADVKGAALRETLGDELLDRVLAEVAKNVGPEYRAALEHAYGWSGMTAVGQAAAATKVGLPRTSGFVQHILRALIHIGKQDRVPECEGCQEGWPKWTAMTVHGPSRVEVVRCSQYGGWHAVPGDPEPA